MMRIFLLIISLMIAIHSTNAQLKSKVSECFELTSIVFRLAGAPEYVNNQLQDYVGNIDNYFTSYKEHPLIPFLQELRSEYGVSYNAIAGATACLVIKKGKVIVNPAFDITKIRKVDPRWTEQTFKTFVTQLNDFYIKTKFRNFYLQHTDFYNVAISRMDEQLNDIDTKWFESVFNEKFKDETIIVSLCNGSSNYSIGFPEGKYGIILGVVNKQDQDGLPWFGSSIRTVIVHELLHHYTNNRLDLYWPQIEGAARKIYPHVKEQVMKYAYGNPGTTIFEWFNSLCEILYIQDHPKAGSINFEQLTGVYEFRGFIWMDRSVRFMKHFYENRDKFVVLDDYMPQIVEFINFTANNFDQVLEEYSNNIPYIVDVFPAPGSTISQDIKNVEICFSKPMFGSYGTNIVDDGNIIMIPTLAEPYWKDGNIFVIPLDSNQLEKGKTYGFKLPRVAFQSKKMFAIKEDFIYTFKISEK